jgi:hypothetical protein
MKPSDMLEYVRAALRCSQSYLCRQIKLQTLDSNDQSAERISNLYFVIKPYIEQGLQGPELFTILETHVFADHNQNRDSVFSALSQDKYSLEILKQIADLGSKRIKKK